MELTFKCRRLLPMLVVVLATASSAVAIRLEEKVCIGTNGRMSVPNNRDHHYRNLRDRYTNCTYVDGNLELTWLQDESQDLSFLQHIREVTGYVLISHVDVTKIVLPSLQIIRGRTLFKLNVHDDEFALLVTLSKMHNLELPALRDILEGSVGILNNYNLCHIKTIDWKEIITGTDAKYFYVYRFSEPERDCSACHESCGGKCWGEGIQNCQKFSKVNCSPQCHQGRCFGPKPRECCHLFCAGGCTGPKQSDCLACRNFYDDGVCKQECPPMQRYNPIKYRWEKNPEGKYAYGATCVKDCPKHLLKDNGACVRSCPVKKKPENGECVPCDGACPKTCNFADTLHAGNIDSLQNCTVIEGSITILETSFTGFQMIYDNFTFGPRYPSMDPSKLEILSTIQEVTGFLNIQAQHPKFKTLNAFRNLEVIGGRTLTEYFSSLYIVKTSLTSLDLRSLRKIRSGGVAILENSDLCFAQNINWQKIMKSPNHNTLLQNNRSPEKCHQEGHVCDEQCSDEGCWGPGNRLCVSCKTFKVGQECVSSCDRELGFFLSRENDCGRCDKECELTCNGVGPGNCTKCKNTKDGPFCVDKCPDGKYDNRTLGECMPCHENCVGGCNGPENNVGPNGCNSCEKAVINADLDVIKCLPEKQVCPDGTFYEYVAPQVQAKLKPLAGKAICRPCHPLCKRCNGYGFHQDVCQECFGFLQDQQCTNECSSDFYTSPSTKECLPCSEECRGCAGPTSAQCVSCKNYKILAFGGDPADNNTAFNCTKTCPSEFPHKVFPENGGDPFCSMEPPHLGQPLIASGLSYPGLVGIIVATVIVISIMLVVSCYYWKQRAKAKENTAKMTLVMTGYGDDEPLQPTNIKPNLAKLNIVKEHELRRGGILGYGAFGTVYKGVWVPEGKNVKIPVAVKELKEGTDKNANQQILDEAYIMASVEHPHLLQLLAVCMTSRLMLVTQLMPLGCLLEYVRNNKDKIGSKPLLNWCRQIASGMAYLEEKRFVHRDLAARNVLVQTPHSIKITDFGLAKLLDINEDEYKAQGGKMPIKWLALECIQHRIFTHKSDVWAFGVTVWELLTFGGKPYENVHPRDLPDLLEKGERLSKPDICTLDVFMILIKCWMVEPATRPSFKALTEEFTRMCRDPGRYLFIAGDKLMRLPSYTTQDEKVLIKNLSSTMGGSEIAITAEEYLNPARIPSQHTLNTPVDTPQPSTPTQKFFPPNVPPPSYNDTIRTSTMHGGPHRQSRYSSTIGINDGFSTLGSKTIRASNFSASCDPLKYSDDDQCDGVSHLPNGTMQSQKYHRTLGPRPPGTVAGLNLDLPVDDEDYLMPSPQSNVNNNHVSNAYMDLIADPKGSTMFQYPPTQNYFLTDYPSNYGRVPDQGLHAGGFSMDNPEYILNEQRRQGDYHTLGIPIVNSSSPSSQGPSSIHSVHSGGQPTAGGQFISLSSNGSAVQPGLNGAINARTTLNGAVSHTGVYRKSSGEESDDHEYYNDLDRYKRERQPLKSAQTISPPQSASSMGSAQGRPPSANYSQQQQQQQQQPMQPFKLLPPPASKHETTV